MLSVILLGAISAAPGEWSIDTSFPGGNAVVDRLDPQERVVSIQPKRYEGRGWDCWWSFKLRGLKPGDTFQLRVQGSSAYAKPTRAAISSDGGKTWKQTPAGQPNADKAMTYTIKAPAEEVWLAWGPPFQLADAQASLARAESLNVGGKVFELCKSKEGRPVPAIRWDPPVKAEHKRKGIWIEARQHAWEAGSSWVGQGFLEFLCSEDEDARWLRQHCRIVYVPIMDVDNVELGAGGKNQTPFDHNRDWNDTPIYPAVAAAQAAIRAMEQAGEFHLFIDLHNPSAGDRVPFFNEPPQELMPPRRQANHERFLKSAVAIMGREPIGLLPQAKPTGANYDKLWEKISKNWVARNTSDHVMTFTLETSWDTPHSTTEGYRSFGKALGRTIADVFKP